MDSCSECRRHLNGALVCPGCGAYAPDIAPPGTGRSPASAAEMPAATVSRGSAPADGWYGGAVSAGAHGAASRPEFERDGGAFPPAFDPSSDPFAEEPVASAEAPADAAGVEDAPPVREGRAARRRQMARWRKNQRRAVVATAVALVGGGLTVASMDRHTADRAQAATVPNDRSMGLAPRHEAPAQTPEPSATPGTHQDHHTAPAPRTPGGTGTVRQTLVTHPHAAPASPHPDADAPAAPVTRPAAASQARTASAAPATDGAGTTAPSTPSAPAPAPTTGGSDQSTAPGAPARASTSPEQLCVLVLCIG
ncbi:hypothetical protein ACF09H_15790 [Streptomyces sp. NPDC014983]|uniref:SCO2400 family protein n=1 Tax=Streptomyces sp. NPDC014983 TaxID=3364933 RepID=UPI0036FB2337